MTSHIFLNQAFGLLALCNIWPGIQCQSKPSQTGNVESFLPTHKEWSFIENKGQFANSEIKYYGHQGEIYLYCKPGMISFVFTKIEFKNTEQISEASGLGVSNVGVQDFGPLHQKLPAFRHTCQSDSNSKITTSRTDLILLNSNPTAQIIASDQQQYYENYYTTKNANHGFINVHSYKTITYKDIYPHIDLILHSREQGMKYEFVVYPGGKTSDIQMEWRGIERIKKIKNSGIEYSLALGKMEESELYTYQSASNAQDGFTPSQSDNLSGINGDKNNRYCEIPNKFILKNGLVGFKTGNYDKSKTLVIDPTLSWATYFGGNNEVLGTGLSTDANGNVFLTGYTTSTTGIATSGAYLTTMPQSFTSAFLAKFNSSGAELWATYYKDSTQAFGVCTDTTGNVFITGYTIAKSGIATNGAYQTALTGNNEDAFLTKFDRGGNLVWGTYFGGNIDVNAYGICCDHSGNIYLTGSTLSNIGIASPGAYKTVNHGGLDAFLAKFSNSGSLAWSTFFGGDKNEEAFDVSADNFGNVYITGYSTSDSGVATTGAYQTSYMKGAGNYPQDVFLAKFSNIGRLSWATYFGPGSSAGQGVSTDKHGNVYMMGSRGIATTGSYQTQTYLNSNNNVFLAKFSGVGQLFWSTYYNGLDAVTGRTGGVCTDASDNVYMMGYTNITKGVSTPGAYQTALAGGYDAFVVQFNSGGKRLWGTYYGGKSNEVGIKVSIDNSENVYILGGTSSVEGIATGGAYQTSYSGSNDAFLAKFSFQVANDAGISSILFPKDSFCSDFALIKVQLKNFGIHELDSVNIGWSLNGKVQNPYRWVGKLLHDSSVSIPIVNFPFSSGADTIRAWTSMPNGISDSFPGNDSAQNSIYIYAIPKAEAGPDTTICYGQIYTMQGAGGVSYLWTPAKYLNNDTLADAKAILPDNQLYTLIVRNSHGCIDSSQVLLKVKSKLKVVATTSTATVCYGQDIALSAIARGGDSLHYQFNWINDSAIGNPITKKVYQSGWHKVILSDNCTPISDTDSVYVNVIVSPTKSAFAYE